MTYLKDLDILFKALLVKTSTASKHTKQVHGVCVVMKKRRKGNQRPAEVMREGEESRR
jgi:hypothetical protein